MQKLNIPDTNVILRYLLADIPEQFELSRTFFDGVRTGRVKASISESVLVECVYVLAKYYNIPRNKISESLSGLIVYKGIVDQERETLLEALKIYSNTRIDIVDCILLSRARLEGSVLFTFDRQLKKLESHK